MHRFFGTENCLDCVVINAAVVIGVAQSPAELLVVRQGLEFVLERIDEEAGTRDIEDFDDTVGPLDEGLWGIKVDPCFLFGHIYV